MPQLWTINETYTPEDTSLQRTYDSATFEFDTTDKLHLAQRADEVLHGDLFGDDVTAEDITVKRNGETIDDLPLDSDLLGITVSYSYPTGDGVYDVLVSATQPVLDLLDDNDDDKGLKYIRSRRAED